MRNIFARGLLLIAMTEMSVRLTPALSRQNLIDFARDGNLIRKGRPNKPRPGSSKGKIGKTTVRGAASTLKDFRTLIRTLRKIMDAGKGGDHKQLQNAYKSVRKAVTFKGGKGR